MTGRADEIRVDGHLHHACDEADLERAEPTHLITKHVGRLLSPLRRKPIRLVRQVDERGRHRHDQMRHGPRHECEEGVHTDERPDEDALRLPRIGHAGRVEVAGDNRGKLRIKLGQLEGGHSERGDKGDMRGSHDGNTS